MKANNLPVLGTKVIVNAIMRRGWAPSEHQLFEVCRKKWRKIPLGKPLAGIFVGARIAWDGYTENRGEDGMSFIPTGHRMVYLVAVSRTGMVRALPEDVRLEDSGVRGWLIHAQNAGESVTAALTSTIAYSTAKKTC